MRPKRLLSATRHLAVAIREPGRDRIAAFRTVPVPPREAAGEKQVAGLQLFDHRDCLGHELQDDPWVQADLALGNRVALVVGDALEVPTGDLVADSAVLAVLVCAAALDEVLDYWREGVIPTVHYSPDQAAVARARAGCVCS